MQEKKQEQSAAAKPNDKSAAKAASDSKQSTTASTTASASQKGAQKKPSGNKKAPRNQGAQQKPWSIEDYQVAPQEGKTRFHDLQLELPLLHAIADLKYEYASEIQAEALPYTLQGHDVIGKAQTGTGKTAAFLITIINDLIKRPIPAADRFASEPRALVIAPTRELALQIEKDAKALTKYLPMNVYSVLGGIDYQKQKDYVRNSVIDILVATPGRLIDFLNSSDLYLDQLDFLVIDEADRMLDMGFIPDVKRILSRCRV